MKNKMFQIEKQNVSKYLLIIEQLINQLFKCFKTIIKCLTIDGSE